MIGPDENINFPPIWGNDKSIYTILFHILFLSTHNETMFHDIGHLPTGSMMRVATSSSFLSYSSPSSFPSASPFSPCACPIPWNYHSLISYPNSSACDYPPPPSQPPPLPTFPLVIIVLFSHSEAEMTVRAVALTVKEENCIPSPSLSL